MDEAKRLRERAEQALDLRRFPAPPQDAVVHELQVHQIELEMQNESLRQSQVALEASRDRESARYQEFYEFAPVGYLTLDRAGKILALNLTAATLLGVERALLLGRRFVSLLAPSDQDRWMLNFFRLAPGGQACQCEVALNRDDCLVFVHGQFTATEDAEPSVRLALTDLSHLRRTERQLRESEERMRLSLEHSPNAMFIANPEGRFTYVNLRAQAMLGHSQAELLEMHVSELHPPEQLEVAMAMFWRVAAGGRETFESVMLHRDGHRIDVEITGLLLPGVGQLGEVRDITLDKRNAEELAHYRQRLEAMLEERCDRITHLDETLAQKQQLLHDVAENVDAAIFVKDLEGRYLLINRCFAELFHVDQGTVLGHVDHELFPMEIAERLHGTDKMVMETGLAQDFEEMIPLDGSPHSYLEHKAPLRCSDGQIYAVCGIVTDITKLRQSQEATRKLNLELEQQVLERTQQSLARYRTILDNAADAIFVANHEGRYLYVNHQAACLLGYTTDELLQMSIADITPPENAEHSYRTFATLLENGHLTTELLLKCSDGSRLPVEINAIRMPDGMVYGACRDITERRRNAEELERYRHELEQLVDERTADLQAVNRKLSDTQFAMDCAGIGIHWVDANSGRLIHVNTTAAAMLGYSVEEMQRLTVPEIDPNFPVEAFPQVMDKVRQQGRAQFESLNRTKDGRTIPVEVSIYFLQDPFDGNARFIAFLTDISQRKEAELALIRAKEQADAANRSKSVFLANMSHEIRTPLGVIIGLSHLLLRKQTDRVVVQRAKQIRASSDHLLAIINDVLDLSKIEAEKLALECEDFDLEAVAAQVLRLIEVKTLEKGLALVIEVTPPLREMCLRGDPMRLAQVLINLCDNAVKFTNQGEVRLRIDPVGETEAGTVLRFAVEDTGIGIAPADQARLFQPFVQVEDTLTRNFAGTGLGLAISQRLVALMGGTIQVSSQEGKGSTFGFELRLPRADPAPATAPNPARPVTEFLNRTVLLADDHLPSREIIFDMLENLGCECDLACDGVEAVERARVRAYDLILMDMQMPRMDGLAATRAIRKLPGGKAVPIVAVTANAFVEDRQRCLDAGMNGHLGKPVTPESLAKALGEWLPDLPPPVAEPLCENELSRAILLIEGLDVRPMWRRSTESLIAYCAQLDRLISASAPDVMRLREHLAANEATAARAIAHDLAGAAGLMGAVSVAALAMEIGRELRAGTNTLNLVALADQGAAELTRLSEALRTLPIPPAEAVIP